MLEQSERSGTAESYSYWGGHLRWLSCFQPFWPPEMCNGPWLTNCRNVCQHRILLTILSRPCLSTVCLFVCWAFKFQLGIQFGANTDDDTGRVNASHSLWYLDFLELHFSHRKGGCEINTCDVVLQCSACLCCFEYSIYQARRLDQSLIWNLKWLLGQSTLVCIASKSFLLGRVCFLSGVVLKAQVSV